MSHKSEIGKSNVDGAGKGNMFKVVKLSLLVLAVLLSSFFTVVVNTKPAAAG
jgi:hypothetical protein